MAGGKEHRRPAQRRKTPKLHKKDKEEIRKLVEENDPKIHGVNAKGLGLPRTKPIPPQYMEKLSPKKQ